MSGFGDYFLHQEYTKIAGLGEQVSGDSGLIVKNLMFDTKLTPKKFGYPCFSKTQPTTIFFEGIEDNLF